MDELERLAAKLDKLVPDPNATIGYDLFAGGLVWSDERPEWEEPREDNGAPTIPGLGKFRALLNYRSSLILATPRERFRDLWERARGLCPHWPGFLPDRCDPGLAEVLRTREAASQRSWEVLDTEYEQQRNKEAKTTNA